MPVLSNGNHWCLALANMEDFFLLIRTATIKKRQNIIFTFKKKIKTQRLSIKGWIIKTMKYKLQSDTFNCGVHVLQYIQQLVGKMPLTNGDDINSYRFTSSN